MENSVEKKLRNWESLCCRCARCCYEKIDFDGQIFYTEMPCEFLDLKTRLCRVYAERDIKRPGCVRLTREIVGKGFLPADCPYVADIENYSASSMTDDHDAEES